MSKKWQTPLESMLADKNKTLTVEELALQKSKILPENNTTYSPPLPITKDRVNGIDKIISIDPNRICNWEWHDRPESELGDIDALAHDMETNGQAQPCTVRPWTKDNTYDYELIAGERRWRAAKLKNLTLSVTVKHLSDHEAAIYQISENSNRKDLSDYAKGMNYAKLIAEKIITQKGLEKAIGKNKTEISRLLSFSHIPQQVWDAIEDPSKISSRTASELRYLINKGEEYLSAVIQLAPKLRTGKVGAKTLMKEVESIILGKAKEINTAEVRNSSGRHLFTWRRDSNGNISISFPKDVRDRISREALESTLMQAIEGQLSKFHNEAV